MEPNPDIELTPSNPRLPRLKTPTEIAEEAERIELPTVTVPPYDYRLSFGGRLSVAVGVILRGEVRRGMGVLIGTSEPTVDDAFRSNPMSRTIEAFKDWKSTLLGAGTLATAVVGFFAGSQSVEELVAAGIAFLAGIVLMLIRPKAKDEA